MSNTESDYNTEVARATEIYQEHGHFIRSVISLKVKNRELADDLYQDLFLTLSTKQLPKDIKNMRGFLFFLITSDIVDSIRRILRNQENLKKYAIYHQQTVTNSDLLDGGIDREEIKAVFRAIKNHLPEREAEAVLSKYKYGYNTKEISKKMGIKHRTVHRYISLGINKIRQALKKEERVSP